MRRGAYGAIIIHVVLDFERLVGSLRASSPPPLSRSRSIRARDLSLCGPAFFLIMAPSFPLKQNAVRPINRSQKDVGHGLRPFLTAVGRFFSCSLKSHFSYSSCLTVERFFQVLELFTCTGIAWDGLRCHWPPSPSCPQLAKMNAGRKDSMAQASKPSPPPVAVVVSGEHASVQDRTACSADGRTRAGGKMARTSQKRAQERACLLSSVSQGRPPRPSDASMSEKRADERARLLAGVNPRVAQGAVTVAVSSTPPTLSSRSERYMLRSAEKYRHSA
jgi:hypothetical protein